MITSDRLHGKIVVITGAAGLLGREHAIAVLKAGGKVALLDLKLELLEEVFSKEVQEFPDSLMLFECDITNEQQVIEISEKICSSLGVPTGLVNNAAINPSVEKNTQTFSRLEKLSYEDWKLQLDVGLFGSLVCSRVFGELMITAGIKGSLVHVSSDHGVMAPNQSLYSLDGLDRELQPVKPVTYSVVKHGLIGLARYLSTYWAELGIRSNTLCPGGVLNGQPTEFIDRFNKLVPMGRLANPDEYRGAIVYLLSDESSYMNGATLVVDGGRSVW